MKTTKFPTAEEMRIISVVQVKKERVQKSVLRKVKRSAEMGYKSLIFDTCKVNRTTWNFLTSKGYVVDKGERQADGSISYTISWNK